LQCTFTEGCLSFKLGSRINVHGNVKVRYHLRQSCHNMCITNAMCSALAIAPRSQFLKKQLQLQCSQWRAVKRYVIDLWQLSERHGQ
jgi:hypothetical protein